jgi:hypothetical protein
MFLDILHCLSSYDLSRDRSWVQGLIRAEFNNLMVSKLSQMLFAVLGLYIPSWCWYRCPEIMNSLIDWAQLNRVLPEDGKRIQSLKRILEK